MELPQAGDANRYFLFFFPFFLFLFSDGAHWATPTAGSTKISHLHPPTRKHPSTPVDIESGRREQPKAPISATTFNPHRPQGPAVR
jgi:hypothetical protein